MRRLALMLFALGSGLLAPTVVAGASPTPPPYALGSATSCKPHYVEVIASHKIKGKKKPYIECVYKGPKPHAPASTPTTTAPSNGSRRVVGSTLDAKDIDDHTLAVTLTQVVDPAQGSDSFDQPDAGNRFIAVDLALANKSTATISDDANSDLTVVGSDNQDYTADFDTVVGCTNFADGEFTLLPGNSVSGCVVFQLPTNVSAKSVQFSFDSGFTNTVQWAV